MDEVDPIVERTMSSSGGSKKENKDEISYCMKEMKRLKAKAEGMKSGPQKKKVERKILKIKSRLETCLRRSFQKKQKKNSAVVVEYDDLLSAKKETPTGPNFLPSSEPGCHVSFFDAPWIVGSEEISPEDFGVCDANMLPDISIDPDSGLLTVINSSDKPRSYFLTITGPGCYVTDGTGKAMTTGFYWGKDGVKKPAVTLVLAVHPNFAADVCFVPLNRLPGRDVSKIELVSDIKDIATHSLPSQKWMSCALTNAKFRFPLLTSSLDKKYVSDAEWSTGSEVVAKRVAPRSAYLCSQGFGGHFTHSNAETCHAIDLECPVGTPILATCDGIVEKVTQRSRVGGIHSKHLFAWNSVLLRLDNGFFAEYVHIAAGSCSLAVGSRVKSGQVICLSGDVGFCPTPHLHFQIYGSAEKKAHSVPFAFVASKMGGSESAFVPVAGKYYNESGVVKAP